VILQIYHTVQSLLSNFHFSFRAFIQDGEELSPRIYKRLPLQGTVSPKITATLAPGTADHACDNLYLRLKCGLDIQQSTSIMFNFASGSKKADSKCYVTHGTMGHLDPKQPPVKRKPYANILAMPFVHKVFVNKSRCRRSCELIFICQTELILPKELYELIQDDLAAKFTTPVYSRVILPLQALLEGDFFNEYIKKGIHKTLIFVQISIIHGF
jgi:hypothetical protein